MKFKLLGALLLLVSVQAGATLIERDLDSSGDGLITYDSDTGLEWLDLTSTTNQSFDQISARLIDLNDDLYGFRYANSVDLNILFFISAGMSASAQFPGETAVNDLISLIGTTLVSSNELKQTRGYYDTGTVVDGKIGWAFLSINNIYSSAGVTDYAAFANNQSNYNGSWLVRAASVPEPSTLAIFALGIIGLVSRKFKKQA